MRWCKNKGIWRIHNENRNFFRSSAWVQLTLTDFANEAYLLSRALRLYYPKTTAKLSLRTSWSYNLSSHFQYCHSFLIAMGLLDRWVEALFNDKWALKLLLLFSDSLLPPSKLFLNLILMGRLASVLSPATYLLAYWAQSFFQSSHNNPGELLQISHKISSTTTITFR